MGWTEFNWRAVSSALVCGLTYDCRQMGTSTGQSTRVSFLRLLLWQGPQKKGSSLPRGTLGPLQKFSPAVTDSLLGSSGLLRVQNRGCQLPDPPKAQGQSLCGAASFTFPSLNQDTGEAQIEEEVITLVTVMVQRHDR